VIVRLRDLRMGRYPLTLRHVVPDVGNFAPVKIAVPRLRTAGIVSAVVARCILRVGQLTTRSESRSMNVPATD
jgi:hypothetical protein